MWKSFAKIARVLGLSSFILCAAYVFDSFLFHMFWVGMGVNVYMLATLWINVLTYWRMLTIIIKIMIIGKWYSEPLIKFSVLLITVSSRLFHLFGWPRPDWFTLFKQSTGGDWRSRTASCLNTEYQKCIYSKANSMFAPSQWEASLQSNAVSHWQGANLESALYSESHQGDTPYYKTIAPLQRSFWAQPVKYNVIK